MITNHYYTDIRKISEAYGYNVMSRAVDESVTRRLNEAHSIQVTPGTENAGYLRSFTILLPTATYKLPVTEQEGKAGLTEKIKKAYLHLREENARVTAIVDRIYHHFTTEVACIPSAIEGSGMGIPFQEDFA